MLHQPAAPQGTSANFRRESIPFQYIPTLVDLQDDTGVQVTKPGAAAEDSVMECDEGSMMSEVNEVEAENSEDEKRANKVEAENSEEEKRATRLNFRFNRAPDLQVANISQASFHVLAEPKKKAGMSLTDTLSIRLASKAATSGLARTGRELLERKRLPPVGQTLARMRKTDQPRVDGTEMKR